MKSSETLDHQAYSSAILYSQKENLSLEDLKKINFFFTGNNDLRKMNVTAGGIPCPDFKDIENLLNHFFELIQTIPHPLSRSAFAYQSICTIHPFINGNGRTARLFAEQILIDNGFPPLIFPAPTFSFVIPNEGEKNPHLLALQRIFESTSWVQKLFPKDLKRDL